MAKTVIRTRNGIVYKMPEPNDHPGVECVVDFDDPETAKSMDCRAAGEEVMRIVVVKNGKRQIVWISLSNFYGGCAPRIRVTAGGRKADVNRDIALRPWLPVTKVAAGEYEVVRS